MPKIAAEMAHSVVITGLRMNGSDKFIAADVRARKRLPIFRPSRSCGLNIARGTRISDEASDSLLSPARRRARRLAAGRGVAAGTERGEPSFPSSSPSCPLSTTGRPRSTSWR